MAIQRRTAGIGEGPGKTWDGTSFVPWTFGEPHHIGPVSRAKPQRQERSNAERIQQIMAESEREGERLAELYLNWWPFAVLRVLARWLECWGCA